MTKYYHKKTSNFDHWDLKKQCSEHNETAYYCPIERRWICPECPVNETLKETGFLVLRNKRYNKR